MNQAVGHVASTIHRTGTRGINSRLFRVRGRIEGGEDLTANNDSFLRRGREVAASRFFRWQRELAADTTINLNGVDRQGSTAHADTLETTLLSDTAPMLAVTQSAVCLAPGCLAAGENWMVFGQFDYGNVGLHNLGGNPGFESNTYGSTLGVEFAVNDCLNVGLGWSHTWSDNDLTGGLGSADIEGDAAILYATYFKNNLWSDLLYSYGSYDVDIWRNALAGTSRANPDLDSHRAALNFGYNIEGDLSCTPFCDFLGMDNRVVHGPTLGIDYTTGSLDGYTEFGNPAADTTFAEQNYDSLTTTVGWQVTGSRETCWGRITPQLRLGYGRESLDQDNSVTGTFAANPTIIATRSAISPGENWMELGVGLSFQFNCSNFGLYIDYTGQYFRDSVEMHYANLSAQMRF